MLFAQRDAARPSTRHGFTLVELLVVIAIISVLAGLLLPSLENAINAARDIACLNQTRQITSGVLLYVNDYEGAVPIHWGRGTADTVDRQDSKSPSNRWMMIVNLGKTRGLLVWPDYVEDGHIFYCPHDKVYNYDHKANGSTGTWNGLGNYPNTGWGGQYYVSYNFPAVYSTAMHTDTNRGGAWTGVSPTYWSVQNYWQFYSTWKNSMALPKIDQNIGGANGTRAMLWDRTGKVHASGTAAVSYFDGSALIYPDALYIHETQIHSIYGARGLTHPTIGTWLRRYRAKGNIDP